MSTSMQDILSDVYADGHNVLVNRKRGVKTPRVTDGLKPKPVARREGLFVLEPEQLLNILVPRIELNGSIKGYQRDFDVKHARKMARDMRGGTPVPVGEVALDGKGRLFAVDCQHRIGAAIMARLPLRVVITRMDKAAQAKLFNSQRKAKAVDPSNLVLAGDGPFERYVKDAIEDKAHPWHPIVSLTRNSRTKISPWQMTGLLVRFVGNRGGTAAGIKQGLDTQWDRGLADQLAPLIACFGNKQTNPPAFRARNLTSIGTAAMWVFRRHETQEGDYERWISHMPQFPFDHYLFIRTERDMTDALLAHWNKRLRGSRRVTRA